MSYLDILIARTSLFIVAIAMISLLSLIAPSGGWHLPVEAVYGSMAYLLLVATFVTSLMIVTGSSLAFRAGPVSRVLDRRERPSRNGA